MPWTSTWANSRMIEKFRYDTTQRTLLIDKKYGNLFHLLQAEPRHIATLCRLVSMQEIDSLLQTVMFTIYGNQYESREEHLLLTMFQVHSIIHKTDRQMVLAHQFEETTEF